MLQHIVRKRLASFVQEERLSKQQQINLLNQALKDPEVKKIRSAMLRELPFFMSTAAHLRGLEAIAFAVAKAAASGTPSSAALTKAVEAGLKASGAERLRKAGQGAPIKADFSAGWDKHAANFARELARAVVTIKTTGPVSAAPPAQKKPRKPSPLKRAKDTISELTSHPVDPALKVFVDAWWRLFADIDMHIRAKKIILDPVAKAVAKNQMPSDTDIRAAIKKMNASKRLIPSPPTLTAFLPDYARKVAELALARLAAKEDLDQELGLAALNETHTKETTPMLSADKTRKLESLAEAQLSNIKKKMAPHMWVVSKDSAGGYLITIGDPRKTSSEIKHRFSGPNAKQELRHWAKYSVGRDVSADHVIDLTGMKLVPDVLSVFGAKVMYGESVATVESFGGVRTADWGASASVERAGVLPLEQLDSLLTAGAVVAHEEEEEKERFVPVEQMDSFLTIVGLSEGLMMPREFDGKFVTKEARVQWVRGYFVVEELPLKGKKKLRRTTVSNPSISFGYSSEFIPENLLRDAKLSKSDNFDRVVSKLVKAVENGLREIAVKGGKISPENAIGTYGPKPYIETLHYLKVTPEDVHPVKLRGKGGWTGSSEWTKFELWAPNSTMSYPGDQQPHYTKYASKSAGAARKLYKMISVDPKKVENFSWDQMRDFLEKNKIAYEIHHSVWN